MFLEGKLGHPFLSGKTGQPVQNLLQVTNTFMISQDTKRMIT